jgi:hypothetical protein
LALPGGSQIAFSFQAVQQRLERAGADAVAVAGQFFNHTEAEDGLLGRVVQDVQTDQAGVEVAVLSYI